MVKSRYLCSAPRPETWDERAEALLKSYGGSYEKMEINVKATLDSLRVLHADKQKTGPGRKSNAEHALVFYEYVLETINEHKEGQGKGERDRAVANAPVPEVPVKRKRGRPRKIKAPDQAAATAAKVVVDTSAATMPTADDNSESIASMDTEEFINQHNDLCEVCTKGGELLMCSTCNLVFHLECVRPKLDEVPPDSWVCAYCVMSGLKGLKQNSKMRKNAAVAVRLMARMRKQLQRQRLRRKQEQEEEGASSTDEDAAIKKPQGDSKEVGGEEEDKKPEAVEAKSVIELEKTKEKESDGDTEGHQKGTEEDKKEVNKELEAAKLAAPPRKRGRPRKHPLPEEKTKEKESDGDTEGHQKGKDEDKKEVNKELEAAKLAAPPRKRGRPRKHPLPEEKSKETESDGDIEDSGKDTEKDKKEEPEAVNVVAPPRKRGRPRKHPLPEQKTKEKESDGDVESSRKDTEKDKKEELEKVKVAAPPRKRGRPRKHPTPEEKDKAFNGDMKSDGKGTNEAPEETPIEADATDKESKPDTKDDSPGSAEASEDMWVDEDSKAETKVDSKLTAKDDKAAKEGADGQEPEDPPPQIEKEVGVSTLESEAGSDRTPQRKNTKHATTSSANSVDDEASANIESTGSGGRARRNRKKATYYNPQSGAASRWQSDGAKEWKFLASQGSEDEVDDASVDDEGVEETKEDGKQPDAKEDGEEDTTETKADAASGDSAKKGPKGPFCNFCKDDQTIPVCCFCACRVCFGKHDQSKILLCDRCDDEYHIFCLSPPLKSVPDSGWFCPSCVETEKRASLKVETRKSKSPKEKSPALRASGRKSASPAKPPSKSAEPSAQPVKRGPGRPRKNPLPETEPDAAPPRKRGRPPKNKSSAEISPPRKRGRPPKSSPKAAPEIAEKKRGPGRPRKNPLPEESTTSSGKKRALSPAPEVIPKKRGRPPKITVNADVAEKKRGPGRPPKSPRPSPKTAPEIVEKKRGPGRPPKASTIRKRSKSPAPKKSEKKTEKRLEKKTEEQLDETKARLKASNSKDEKSNPTLEVPKQPRQVKMSRSGRTVKRTSFHDEIDEGEQHLKSIRYVEVRRKSTKGGKGKKSRISEEEGATEEDEEEETDELEAEDDETGDDEEQSEEEDVYHSGAHAGVDVEHLVDAHDLHEVDTHFLENMPDVSDMSHLVNLDDNFVGHGDHMDVVEASHVLPEPMDIEEEEAKKPAAVVTTQHTASNDVPVAESDTKMAPGPVSFAASLPAASPTNSGLDAAASMQETPPAVAMPAPVAAVAVLVPSAVAAAIPPPENPQPALPTAFQPPLQQPAVMPLTAAQGTTQRLAAVAATVAGAPAVATGVAAALIPAGYLKPPPVASLVTDSKANAQGQPAKVPRRKPGARECMQISRRFGVNVIPDKWMETLLDYCKRGKVEHLIRMRERLDDHSVFLQSQLAELEALVQERGESDIIVPAMPEGENEGGGE